MNLTDIPPDVRADLVLAALRYAAVADWFEARPCRWKKNMPLADAMGHFNQVEAQLRAACGKVLRAPGHRAYWLEAAGVPQEAR